MLVKKNMKIRFLWSGNSDLQIHIIKPKFFKDNEINILDLSQNESRKKELLKLNNCEDVDLVLKKYSSFFESETLPFLKNKNWI